MQVPVSKIIAFTCFSFLTSALLFSQKTASEGHAGETTYFVDSDNTLRLVQTRDLGRFDVNEDSGFHITTDFFKNSITRRTYDNLERLVKKEVWQTGTSAKSAELISVTTWVFKADMQIPASSTEQLMKEKKQNEIEYTDDGKPARCLNITFTDGDDGKKESADCLSVWKYDSHGHILVQDVTTYYPVKTVTKDVFDYSGKGKEPDHTRYRNGEICMRTLYENPSKYIKTVYFDMGYSVETTYENGNMVSERYLLNGNEMRYTDYDRN